MMTSIREELTETNDDDEMVDAVDYTEQEQQQQTTPVVHINGGQQFRSRGDRSLAQQALLNRALGSRRHTLANVLR